MPVPRRLAAAALISAAVIPAAPAAANRSQLSIFQDDEQLVLSGKSARERTLDDVQELGADTIHSVVFWHKVAPAPFSNTRPTFNGGDPASYPPELWDAYDGLVRGATARGMDLILSPSSPMPAWASSCSGPRKVRRVCKPNLTQFKRFVQALGKRYSGEYTDENENHTVLPRVSKWSIWNEPNQGGWLQPQYEKQGGRSVPASPVIYRDLVRAAIKGLNASGHSDDDVLMGETAPIGRETGSPATRPIPPGKFIRAVLCIDDKGKALKGSRAKALDCSGFRKLPVTGISHHPYTRGGSRPPTTKGSSNEITISSISRLKTILKQGASHSRIPRGLDIFYTEYGFQTDPPDSLTGVPLVKQAAYINQSDWIVYRDKQVRSVAQYELRDEAALSAFQTGLRFVDGTEKPSFDAYRLPIWVSKGGAGVKVWGQVRPAADGALEDVEVQGSTDGSSFETQTTLQTTNTKGFVETSINPGAIKYWRLRWTPKDGGSAVTSRVAEVGK